MKRFIYARGLMPSWITIPPESGSSRQLGNYVELAYDLFSPSGHRMRGLCSLREGVDPVDSVGRLPPNYICNSESDIEPSYFIPCYRELVSMWPAILMGFGTVGMRAPDFWVADIVLTDNGCCWATCCAKGTQEWGLFYVGDELQLTIPSDAVPPIHIAIPSAIFEVVVSDEPVGRLTAERVPLVRSTF
jgi:hypothetical protein